MNRRSLLIEFIGLPGSGKTTLCNSVYESLNSRGVVVRKKSHIDLWKSELTLFKKLVIRFKAFVISFFLFFFLLLITFKLVDFSRLYLICLSSRYVDSYLGCSDVQAIIFHQWVGQGIWSLQVNPNKKNIHLSDFAYRIIFKFIKLPDVVQHIDVPSKVAAKRIASRCNNGSRFEGDEIITIECKIAGSDDVLSDVVLQLQHQGVIFFSIDNSNGLCDSAHSAFFNILGVIRLES